MLDILQKALAFVFVLGVLIAFHELGHFWVARRLGVKVLRFSVGFGKPLLRYQANADSPEYVLAAFPLGGYVKMLDEREGEVPAEQRHQAFNRQSVWTRIAIVAAGPLFNLALAVLLFTLVFVNGIPGLQPVLAAPEAGTLAARAGLQDEDKVVAVNDLAVDSWAALRLAVVNAAVDGGDIELAVQTPTGAAAQRVLSLGDENVLAAEGDALARMGLRLWRPSFPAVLGEVAAGMPADAAGLSSGERVLAVDKIAVTDWAHLVSLVRARPGQRVDLSVQAQAQSEPRVVSLTLAAVEDAQGQRIGRLGAGPQVTGDPYANYRTVVQYNLWQAAQSAVQKTWNMSVLTVKMIGKLIVGNASLKNISGPLSIAQYAGETAEIGLIFLIDFMAVISVSLGVLNLLPIPVLDGGHLLFYLLELCKGSPVSERTQLLGQQLGIVLLLTMMSIAFYNDITRIFG